MTVRLTSTLNRAAGGSWPDDGFSCTCLAPTGAVCGGALRRSPGTQNNERMTTRKEVRPSGRFTGSGAGRKGAGGLIIAVVFYLHGGPLQSRLGQKRRTPPLPATTTHRFFHSPWMPYIGGALVQSKGRMTPKGRKFCGRKPAPPLSARGRP